MRFKLNQRGQGTVEYLLVVLLSVAIILGAIFQLNTAFRAWADNYFGDYLTCLLETGELPSLTGGSDGLCDQSFKPFSIAEGRPAVGDGIGAGGGSGGSSNDQNESEQESSEATSAGGASASADSGSRGAGGFRASNRGGTRFRVRAQPGDADGANGSDQAGAVTFNSYDQGGRVVRIPVRETEAMRQRRYREDQKDPERTKARTESSLAGDEREGAPVLIKKASRKAASEAEEEGFEWSFGWVLRILIILAILIALLLFLGGQALQVTKSMD